MAIGFAFASALLWGAGAIFSRLGLLRLPAAYGTFISMIVSLALVAALALIFDWRGLASLSGTAIGWLALLGALNFVAGRYMNMNSVRLAGSSRATPVVSISPLFAAAFAFTFLGERPTPLVIAGTLAIVGGVGLIVSQGLTDRRGAPADSKVTIGLMIALVAAIGYGASNVLTREITTGYASPLVGSAVSLLFGTLYLLPLAMRERRQVKALPGRDMKFLAASGLVQGIGVTTMMAALSLAPVAVVVPIGSLNPVVALVLAHLFLGQLEKITPRIILGTLLAVGGVALVIIGRG